MPDDAKIVRLARQAARTRLGTRGRLPHRVVGEGDGALPECRADNGHAPQL